MWGELTFDADLIKKHDRNGPRYTSYPTALQFNPNFGPAEYAAAARASNARGGPLSIYVHLPFCATACYYCGCNKIATKQRGKVGPYLAHVEAELDRQAALFDPSRPVEQLHLGGGTPTFLDDGELEQLLSAIGRRFRLLDDDRGEYSIEIDPREVDRDTIALLRRLGFNRMSLGVQDFDPVVQRAVNRIQSDEVTREAIEAARESGFRSISVDLIYGLPFQSRTTFGRTLDQVLALSPDRLSVFNYAHLPERFKQQRRIAAFDLPPPAEKLAILEMTIQRLTDAGYVYIGMDHFARPDDELAIAQREGTLQRNFQGYSTHGECDLIGIGVSSIGKIGDVYAQNIHLLDGYYQRLDRGGLAIFRGYALDADDKLRRAVINQLICHFTLDYAAIERAFEIDFAKYFAAELASLAQLEQDGLLVRSERGIEVQPLGKLLIRNVCMSFDRYLTTQSGYSKVI